MILGVKLKRYFVNMLYEENCYENMLYEENCYEVDRLE